MICENSLTIEETIQNLHSRANTALNADDADWFRNIARQIEESRSAFHKTLKRAIKEYSDSTTMAVGYYAVYTEEYFVVYFDDGESEYWVYDMM